MQSVTVVAAELGVDTLQGRVTVGLRLLDTVGEMESVNSSDCIGEADVYERVARYGVERRGPRA